MKKFSVRIGLILVCGLLFTMSGGLAFAASADEREVVVTGMGRSENEAKLQAYRNGIRTVIGSMVLSEVLVENETLIRDQVLSHSDGFVTKASQVGGIRNLGNGLLEVTMRVTVKSRQLQQKLQAEKITVTAVDGQSLFAQKVTQDEVKKDAAAILAEKVANLPAGVLVAEADITNSQQESSPGMVRLTLPVKVAVDFQAYGAFIKDLNATMASLGFKATPMTNNGYSLSGDDLRGDLDTFFTTMTGESASNAKGKFLLGLCDLINKNTKTSRWKLYSIPKEAFEALLGGVRTFALSVELRDASEQAITVNEISYAQGANHNVWAGGYDLYSNYPSTVSTAVYSTYEGSHIAILPQLPLSSYDFALFPVDRDALVFNLIFDLTEEELKSIKSVHCTITNIERK